MEPVLTAPAGNSSRERALLVNRYAMPFAVLTVCLAIVLGGGEGWTGKLSIGLLIFGSVFNVASGRYLSAATASSRGFIRTRMGVNLLCNALIVWMLGGYWTPAWLLLALTPLASAIYASRKETFILSVGVSVFLLLRYAILGPGTPLEWGEQFIYGLFIVLSSSMINELVRAGLPAKAS